MILEDLFCPARPQNFNAVESAWRERSFISRGSSAAALKQEILENVFKFELFVYCFSVNKAMLNKSFRIKCKDLSVLVIRGGRSYLRRVSVRSTRFAITSALSGLSSLIRAGCGLGHIYAPCSLHALSWPLTAVIIPNRKCYRATCTKFSFKSIKSAKKLSGSKKHPVRWFESQTWSQEAQHMIINEVVENDVIIVSWIQLYNWVNDTNEAEFEP